MHYEYRSRTEAQVLLQSQQEHIRADIDFYEDWQATMDQANDADVAYPIQGYRILRYIVPIGSLSMRQVLEHNHKMTYEIRHL